MKKEDVADLLEIQQLAARYMSLSSRKDNDHWAEVFTPDGVYNAFGTPYGPEDFPQLLKSAPPGQYIGNMPVVTFDGDTGKGIQHYVFIEQATHEMRLGWYNDEFVRTPEGWRIRSRSTTFMRRNGGFDSGNPSRYVAGKAIAE